MLKETVEREVSKAQIKSAWQILKERRESVVVTQESYSAAYATIADDLYPERHKIDPPGEYITVTNRYRNDGDAPHIRAFKIIEKYFDGKLDSRMLSVIVHDKNTHKLFTKVIDDSKFDNFLLYDMNLTMEFNCGTTSKLLFLLTQLNKLTPFSQEMQKNLTLHFCKTDAKDNQNANKFRSSVFRISSLSDLCYAFIRDKYKIFSLETLNRLPLEVKDNLPIQSDTPVNDINSAISGPKRNVAKARMLP